ncbi:LAO/AO transport system ATPase [Gemmatirosa kalamazoonensis]|uniref:LAO/AO transport system ATPase n=1 Tax=Gemmatirosa kalamazoonensis TaxID=861299 RepID=W0RKB9_9BACT|nr:methylmalonyl Co-A mutase-associated GTPase MeaB [Gemmatirosa kalamazoonensis]AHG90887.1 LAO/AO transport system ATPase [Gemmatirosa kalamazoonensis]
MTLARASDPIARLLDDFRDGKKAALARAVSVVENHRPGFDRLLAALHPSLGRARRVGLTGPPGAGKSTMTTALARLLRDQGHTVGIVAVDPTSPFTGGALLGDRIRMESVALDPGVFIRSMATRGSLGGIASATREVCDVLDGFGIDFILIETVGVGQSELDVARASDTTLVVLVPESGDSIQTLKAGVMEIADVFVVNKADRPGADRLRNDIELMLGLRGGAAMRNVPAHHGVDLKALSAEEREATRQAMNPARAARAAASADHPERWVPPVLQSVAAKGEGIVEVLGALDRHFRYLEASGELRSRRRARLRERVVEVVEQKVRSRLWADTGTMAWLDERLAALESGTLTPFGVADELLERSAGLIARSTLHAPRST